MLVAGVDVGSLNVSVVIWQNGCISSFSIIESGEEGASASYQAIEDAASKIELHFADMSYIVATGCGRNSVPFAPKKSSEVVCQAKGALWLFPEARTVVNLGAVSSRVISINEKGRVQSFASNDKCAAGSGLFLESMSRLLQVPVNQMGDLATEADGWEEITSICAVFAESEVISHIHRGVPKERILAGLHHAIAGRILELISKVDIRQQVVVTGGIAKNTAIITALEQKLGNSLLVPEEPQIVGALGAALSAAESLSA